MEKIIEKKETSWTAGNGTQINLSVELRKSGDGKVFVAYNINGQAYYGMAKINHPIAVAQIGNVGLKKEHYEFVLSAVSDLEKSPQMVEYKKRIAAKDAEFAEYFRSDDEVKKSMKE